MAHEIEYRADRKTNSFAFVGNRSAIWHGLGQQAQDTWSEDEWIAACNQDFTVAKIPLCGQPEGEVDAIAIEDHKLLIRTDNGSPLSIVTTDWEPAQNKGAWDFARPIVQAGLATYNTAGTLFGGQTCFVLLKTNDGFQLPGADDNELFVFVQISHRYGLADLVVPVVIRVVCDNTRRAALSRKSKSQLDAGKFVHREKTSFSVEKAHALIESYRLGLNEYAEQARFLTTKQARPEQIKAYINKVFGLQELLAPAKAEDIAKRHEHNEQVVSKLLQTIETQPGANLSAGTWWSVYNGATYHEDHGKFIGRTEKLSTKLLGASDDRKQLAFRAALEFAA